MPRQTWLARTLYDVFDRQLILTRQPIFHTQRQEIRYEILLRLKTSGGLTSAFAVVEDCELHNTISVLDRWVLERTFKFLTECPDGAGYSVNLSPDSLSNQNSQDLVSFIWENLRSGDFDPQFFGIELIERYSLALVGRADVQGLILHLKQIGCRVAMDDFGEGRHSLTDVIATIQPTSIKIDGSFVRAIASNPQTCEMVRHLVEIAKLYGIEATAECVETQEIADKAIELGFDWLQGYHLGRPEPLPR